MRREHAGEREARWRHERYLIAERARFPEQQRYPGRVCQNGRIDVDDIRQGNALGLRAIFDDEMIAFVDNFVDKIEQQKLEHEVGEGSYDRRRGEKRKYLERLSGRDWNSQAKSDEDSKKTQEKRREDPLIEERHPRRNEHAKRPSR